MSLSLKQFCIGFWQRNRIYSQNDNKVSKDELKIVLKLKIILPRDESGFSYTMDIGLFFETFECDRFKEKLVKLSGHRNEM